MCLTISFEAPGSVIACSICDLLVGIIGSVPAVELVPGNADQRSKRGEAGAYNTDRGLGAGPDEGGAQNIASIYCPLELGNEFESYNRRNADAGMLLNMVSKIERWELTNFRA